MSPGGWRACNLAQLHCCSTIHAQRGAIRYVFPGERTDAGHMSEKTIDAALRRLANDGPC